MSGFRYLPPYRHCCGIRRSANCCYRVASYTPNSEKGKKDAYEGPGVVGEAGAELIEKDGQLYVAPKKTIVWLGAKDKVFNPQETIRMMEKPGLQDRPC